MIDLKENIDKLSPDPDGKRDMQFSVAWNGEAEDVNDIAICMGIEWNSSIYYQIKEGDECLEAARKRINRQLKEAYLHYCLINDLIPSKETKKPIYRYERNK